MINPPDFDALYRSNADPFDVGTSWYEQRKLAVVLACLAQPSYRLAWDAAAGSGHLARRLAERCNVVLATDASGVAVASWHDLPDGFTAQVSALPAVPAGASGADLVVLSEVLYYLDAPDRAVTAAAVADIGAEVVAVNWRHHPHDAHLSGAEALDELRDALIARGFTPQARHEEPDFVLCSLLPSREESDDR